MYGNSKMRRGSASRDPGSPATLAAASMLEPPREDFGGENSDPRHALNLYRIAVENVSQGICVFDRNQRLVLCNAHYAEIYGLQQEQVRPGVTLREIVELRAAAGTCSTDVNDYLEFCTAIHSGFGSHVWNAVLNDGRTIRVRHQGTDGGGWVSTHEDVTESLATRTLTKELTSLQALIDCVPDNLWVKNREGRFVVVNKAAARAHGRDQTHELLGLTDFDLHEPEVARTLRALENSLVEAGQALLDREVLFVDRMGAERWLSASKAPLRDPSGEIIGILGISRDITERKLSESLNFTQANILEMIATSAPLPDILKRLVLMIEAQLQGIYGSILLLDTDGVHLRAGAAPSLAVDYCAAIEGAAIGPKVGSCGTAVYRRESVIVTDIETDPLWEDYRELAASHGYRSCWSTPILSYPGEVLGAFAMYSKTVRAPQERELRLIETATRIAGIAIERRRTEEHINYLATHDALTGLPNRSLVGGRVLEAIAHAQLHGCWAAIVFVDLDNFKSINDSLGHGAGDEVLKTIANRMAGAVGAAGDVLRFGGDEFVVVLRGNAARADELSGIVQALRSSISAPLALAGQDVRVNVSMGVAVYPADGSSPEKLLANADAAMYRAKEMGRDTFQYFTPALNAKAHGRLQLETELRAALARAEFRLLYQPQFDLTSGRCVAVEALIRWNHPTRGLLRPADFLLLAEETGLIGAIGEWALREACQQFVSWRGRGLAPSKLGINLSARQFRDKGLATSVGAQLAQSGMAAENLDLEVTETVIANGAADAITIMQELVELGVSFSIDDFGSGYSSLAGLRSVPVSRLKIDSSFVAEIEASESGRGLVKAIVALAKGLGLTVVAEGVETAAQLAFLRTIGCDEVQGFFLCPPSAPEVIEERLRGAGATAPRTS